MTETPGEGRGNRERTYESTQASEGDTVRILPDDMSSDQDAGEPGRPTLQRGTLYSPAPVARAYEPYDQRPLERTARPGRSTHAEYAPEPQPGQTRYESERPQVVQVRRGPSACAIVAGTFSLLTIACALLAFATLRNGLDGFGKLGGWMPSFGLVTTPTVVIDTSRPVVIEQIRALSKLETVHYQMQKVVSGKSTGPLPEFLTSDKILLVAQGEVVAGMDLSKLEEGDISVEGDRVTIKLPIPEILYSKIDNDKTYVYDRQTGIFSKPDPNLETQLRQAAEKEIRQSATEDDILGKARTNAEQVVRSLITGLGYKEVVFRDNP